MTSKYSPIFSKILAGSFKFARKILYQKPIRTRIWIECGQNWHLLHSKPISSSPCWHFAWTCTCCRYNKVSFQMLLVSYWKSFLHCTLKISEISRSVKSLQEFWLRGHVNYPGLTIWLYWFVLWLRIKYDSIIKSIIFPNLSSSPFYWTKR